MSLPRTPIVRCLVVVLGACALALGVSACGDKFAHPTFANSEDTASSGLYVDAGPITYQVQIARQLNQYSTEDSNYLVGVPASVAPPAPDEMWFAVFLWAKNQTHHNQTTTDSFTITDTQSNVYRPIAINHRDNPLSWTTQTLAPGATEPGPDTAAADDPTQGSELLFKLNEASAYANRPLTLNIMSPGATTAKVQLDL